MIGTSASKTGFLSASTDSTSTEGSGLRRADCLKGPVGGQHAHSSPCVRFETRSSPCMRFETLTSRSAPSVGGSSRAGQARVIASSR